jgi:hypothetical protein
MNWKTILLWCLLIAHAGLGVWLGYSTWTGRLAWYLGVSGLVVTLIMMRNYVWVYRQYPPLVDGPAPQEVAVRSAPPPRLTPAYIEDILSQPTIREAIGRDLKLTGQLRYHEMWRLGLITPDQDRYDPNLGQYPNRWSKWAQDPAYKFYVQERLPLKRCAILYGKNAINAQLNTLTVVNGLAQPHLPLTSLFSYPLETKLAEGDYARLRDFRLDAGSTFTSQRRLVLPDFLREEGFPLGKLYTEGDPLSADRGGVIVNAGGKLVIIRPNYFVQRRLIDDAGNLVQIGLDEELSMGQMYSVLMRPSLSRYLVAYIKAHHYVPVVRYRSFPCASDYLQPVLDTPLSENGWADLVIDPRGRAKLFIAKDKTLEQWYEMLNRLRTLYFAEVALKDYHLLGLTKDAAQMAHYLAEKQAILADYYLIQDYSGFLTDIPA